MNRAMEAGVCGEEDVNGVVEEGEEDLVVYA